MDNSIERLLQSINELILHVEAYKKCLQYQVIYKPKQVLDDALRHGFPEDIYQHYLNAYYNRNAEEAQQILRDIDNRLLSYLERVMGHLRDALEDVNTTTDTYVGSDSIPTSTTTDVFPVLPSYNADVQSAIDKNNVDLEINLGVKKGEEMTVAEADMQHANPRYWLSSRYRINCATCAAAFILRLRGFHVKAKGVASGSDNEWLSNGHSFDIWRNADGTKPHPNYMQEWMRNNGLSYMEPDDYRRFFDENCKEEGFYILTLNWMSGSGHATILQRDKQGNLYNIEPQLYDGDSIDGRKSIDEIIYDLSPLPYENKAVMRVDDKVFDTRFSSLFYTA